MGRRYFWTLLTPRLNGSSELCFQLTKLTENYIGIISKFCIALHCLIFYILAFHRSLNIRYRTVTLSLVAMLTLSRCHIVALSQCWRYRVVTLSLVAMLINCNACPALCHLIQTRLTSCCWIYVLSCEIYCGDARAAILNPHREKRDFPQQNHLEENRKSSLIYPLFWNTGFSSTKPSLRKQKK